MEYLLVIAHRVDFSILAGSRVAVQLFHNFESLLENLIAVWALYVRDIQTRIQISPIGYSIIYSSQNI